jgi:hypothetical protein
MFLWFWIGNHDKKYCKPFIHPLYALIVPFVRNAPHLLMLMTAFNTLSSKYQRKVAALLLPCSICLRLTCPAVILIRVYAFTGRSNWVLGGLGVCLLALFAMQTWLFGTQFVCEWIFSKPINRANITLDSGGGDLHSSTKDWVFRK